MEHVTGTGNLQRRIYDGLRILDTSPPDNTSCYLLMSDGTRITQHWIPQGFILQPQRNELLMLTQNQYSCVHTAVELSLVMCIVYSYCFSNMQYRYTPHLWYSWLTVHTLAEERSTMLCDAVKLVVQHFLSQVQLQIFLLVPSGFGPVCAWSVKSVISILMSLHRGYKAHIMCFEVLWVCKRLKRPFFISRNNNLTAFWIMPWSEGS